MAKKKTVYTYKALTDCTVFGHYRAAGETFSGPDWKSAYDWAMPSHIVVADGDEPGDDQGEAPTVADLG